MTKTVKYECVEQLFDEEICFDHKALLLSLEAYLGRQAVIEALEYISRVEDWRYRITPDGKIVRSDDDE